MKCRVCDNRVDVHSWGAGTCTVCRSINIVEIPDERELAAFYASYGSDYHGGGRAEGASERQRAYARKYLATVREYKLSGKLLDIGSSTNPFPNYAAEAGYHVTALDYVRPAELDNRVEFVAGRAEPRNELRGRFDIVTAFAVIEHTPSPREVAAAMASFAVPGGILILTTPLIGDIFERHTAGKTRWFCPPEHLHLLSKRGMLSLFRSVGCEPLKAGRFELSWTRWTLRYGEAAAEGTLGMATHIFAPPIWRAQRHRALARAHQIGLYVFRKN